MAINAHDIQVFLWKILKLFSKTCVRYSLKHPFLSFSMLCLFLLYMAFPLVFWVLVYSVPLVVCTTFILSMISFKRRKYESDSRQTRLAPHDSADDKKKPFARVHSVRRRRAKEFMREENKNTKQKVEEKNAVSSTNFNYDMVDKNTLTGENSPIEIREVEVIDYSLVNSTKSTSCSASQSSKHEFDESGYQSFEDGNEDGYNNNNTAMQGNEEDDYQKNKMDVGISDSERNKRLESLIARRRSRKLLSLEVRRTLMNMERNNRPQGQISSIFIPKNNNMSRLLIPSNSVVNGGPISPSPGSAPSVLIPMRNPFDLPYDPQEEKPDLTGDSFEQEFMSANNRDMMFCRHESFSLGPFLPGEYNRNLKETSSSVPDSRFRQRTSSSLGYQFSKPSGKDQFDGEFTPIMERESYEPSESKPTIAGPQDDHIKEIIQVHENGSRNGSEEDDIDEIRTRPTPEEDTSRSPTSSGEDMPVFKIDREAILKSLSSMARRNALQEETENNNNNDQIGEHLSRLKDQFYYADRTTRRHVASYSIASDLQVEVSEVSSPPLTIDENLSDLDYDEDNHSTYDEDSWAVSSHFDLSQVDEYELRSIQVDEFSKQDTALLDEKHCAHPWCAISEFPDSCQTNRATNLEEKIDKTLQPSLSLVAHTSNRNDSRETEECSHVFNESEKELNTLSDINGSKIVLEDNTNRIEESTTIETKTDEGQFEKLDECHNMEHLAAESVKSSEDSEERLETEHQEMIMESTIVEDQINLESIQQSEGELRSAEASITRAALGSNVHEAQPNLMPNVVFELVQSSLLSPKSVLHPTCSVSSFDHYVDDEVHQFNEHTAQVSSPIARQNSTAFMEHSAAPPDFDGEEVEVYQESSEPSNTSTSEADYAESLKQQKIHENGIKQEEAACGSSRIPSSHEAPAEPTEETSSTSFNNDDEVSNKEFLTAFNRSTDHSDDSNSPLSTAEELSKHQEIFIGEATQDDRNESSSNEGQTENSALHEEKGNEHNLNHPKDQERQANSTSNCFDGTKDEVRNLGADETPIFELSGPVEDNVNSESYKKK